MQDYQHKRDNPYFLPQTLYRRVLSVIRDYRRQRGEVNDILYGTHNAEVVVTGGIPKSPVESIAIRLEKYTADIEAVEKALEKIPPEYRKSVFENIADGKRFPETAHYNTWLRWRKRFVYYVAKEFNLV